MVAGRRRVVAVVIAVPVTVVAAAAVVVVVCVAGSVAAAVVVVFAVRATAAVVVVVVIVIIVVIVVVVVGEGFEGGRRWPVVNDLGAGGGVRVRAVRVGRVGGRALEEVQGRWRRQRLGFDLDGRQYGGGDVVGFHFHVGLGAQHVGVLRVELLYARGNVLPEGRPEEHVVVVGRGGLTPRRDETRLRPAHGPPDLEEVLHLDRGLPGLLLRVILVEFLQPVEVLSTQQRVQIRGLLEIEHNTGREI